MDSPPTGEKNLRTQIWGGKDRGLGAEAKGCSGRNFGFLFRAYPQLKPFTLKGKNN